MPHLTGDSPTESCDVTITVPRDDNLRRAIFGQLSELAFPHNWEQFGTATSEEFAELMQNALQSFQVICFSTGAEMIVNVQRSTTYTGTLGAYTKIPALDTVLHNSGEWNPGQQRVDIAEDGLYLCGIYSGMFGSNAARTIHSWYLNTIQRSNHAHIATGQVHRDLLSLHPLPLSAGDFLEAYIFQDGATALVNLFTSIGIGILIWRLGDL